MKRGEWSFRGFDTEKETGFLPVSFSICAPSTHRTKPSPRGMRDLLHRTHRRGRRPRRPGRTHRWYCQPRANPQPPAIRRRAGCLRPPPFTDCRFLQAGASQPAQRPDRTKHDCAEDRQFGTPGLRGTSRTPSPTNKTAAPCRARCPHRAAPTVGADALGGPAERTDGIANPGRTRNRPPYDRIGQNTIAPKTGNLAPPACAGRRGRRPLRIKLPHRARAVDEGRPPASTKPGKARCDQSE